MEAGYYATARAYIVYRERHGRLRRDRHSLIDVAASMNEYLSREDWRVQANANQGYSLGGLILNVSGKVTANYWLDEVYSPAIGSAHREADLHVHDLDMLAGYCAGWSLRTLLNEGLNGIPGFDEAVYCSKIFSDDLVKSLWLHDSAYSNKVERHAMRRAPSCQGKCIECLRLD